MVSAACIRLLPAVSSGIGEPAGGPLQHPLQDQLLHVGGAFVDLAHPHVAVDPLHRVVREDSRSRRASGSPRCRSPRRLRRRTAWPCRRLPAPACPSAFSRAACSVICRAASSLVLASTSRNADRLVVDDRLAEGGAVARIGDRVFQRRARHAHALRGDADAPGLQGGQRDPVAFALGADALVVRDFHVLERQRAGVRRLLAELFLHAAATTKPGRGLVDDEAGDALACRRPDRSPRRTRCCRACWRWR